MTDAPRKVPVWSVVGLVLALLLAVAWRWHTIGPSFASAPFEGWLVRSGPTEPLDCDEAVYAYMGRRLLRGDVLYRDLVENKPPLGYWLYALAVGIGGANEMTVRLMAFPYVLATIALIWRIGLRVGGPASACVAAFVYAIAIDDPYIFGNGSNMEHFLNLFSVASLALMLRALDRGSRAAMVGAGVLVALGSLVKQVAAVDGVVYGVVLLWPRGSRGWRERVGDGLALAAGFVVPWAVALGLLFAQGAGLAAYECMVTFARATATDVPPTPHSPPMLVRLVTGNADPEGKLPWPFGKTDYYVWWGAGLWPLWIVGVGGTIRLFVRSGLRRTPDPNPLLQGEREPDGGNSTAEHSLLGGEGRVRGSAGVSDTSAPHPNPPPQGGRGPGFPDGRPLLGLWIIAAWAQVLLPGQFWPHYYMLPLPGVALAVAVWLVDSLGSTRRRAFPNLVIAATLLGALGWSLHIQVRDYLGKTPEAITSAYKGGRQWVALRKLGREIGARASVWDEPRLFIWGWQSPLYIYAGLDGVSRHVFANELFKAHAGDDHPLVSRWVGEIMTDLRARPPALIFAGHPPFPALRAFLNERYLPSTLEGNAPDGRGLWVEREKYGEFHARSSPTVRP